MERLIKKKFKGTANQGLCLEVQQRLSKKSTWSLSTSFQSSIMLIS